MSGSLALAAAVFIVIVPGAAVADTNSATACAAVLPTEAKAICDATAPEFGSARACAGAGQGEDRRSRQSGNGPARQRALERDGGGNLPQEAALKPLAARLPLPA